MMTPIERTALEHAHRAARLHGSLDEALSNSTLAKCLANTVDSLARRSNRPLPRIQQPTAARDFKRASAGDHD